MTTGRAGGVHPRRRKGGGLTRRLKSREKEAEIIINLQIGREHETIAVKNSKKKGKLRKELKGEKAHCSGGGWAFLLWKL